MFDVALDVQTPQPHFALTCQARKQAASSRRSSAAKIPKGAFPCALCLLITNIMNMKNTQNA
jgi:hypothetical protein